MIIYCKFMHFILLKYISIISEGLLITCSYDYLTEDWNHKSFILYAFICNYCFPMIAVIYFYSQVCQWYFTMAVETITGLYCSDALKGNLRAKLIG